MQAPTDWGRMPPEVWNGTFGPYPGLQGPSECDRYAVADIYCPNTGCAGSVPDYECMWPNTWNERSCACEPPFYSPVVIDVNGDGFNLTGSGDGVSFDINGDGRAEQLSWTSGNSDEAWLSLDQNENGLIDDGKELFGNHTPQPPSETPNGFLALAEFDHPLNGGYRDGVIDEKDFVFPHLRLWQDLNHNGVSEPTELHTLQSLGLIRLHLSYKESKRTDEHGNRFLYRAKVDAAKGTKVSRWAWDVFLVLQQ